MNAALRQIAMLVAEAEGVTAGAARAVPVGGGCISDAFRLEIDHAAYFVKLNKAQLLPMFEAEQRSLQAILETGSVLAPRPILTGRFESQSFLVLEYLDIRRSGSQSELGRQLAAMHGHQASRYGWPEDNFIGATPQRNTWSDDWPAFFAEQRLQPQINLAAARGRHFRQWPELKRRIPEFFESYSPAPSLLHGDLWSGNAGFCAGKPVVFDPACYYGDRETDIAFTEMFGGFSEEFYAAYNLVWPLDEGYTRRKHLYNLYHLLNHFNLFGGGYGSEAEAAISSLCSRS